MNCHHVKLTVFFEDFFMYVCLLNYEFKVALFIVHRKKNLVRNNRSNNCI